MVDLVLSRAMLKLHMEVGFNDIKYNHCHQKSHYINLVIEN